MKYILVIVFLSTGEVYVERSSLTLEHCAGIAAVLKTETKDLEEKIGPIAYYCKPQEK